MKRFDERIGGGCLCGAVRYSIAAYEEAVHCHCAACRRASGAAFLTWVSVRKPDFRLEAGQPSHFRHSPIADRQFCRECGSTLFMTYDGDAETSVTLGTLDAPDLVKVDRNIFTAERLELVHGFETGISDHRNH